MAQYTFLKSSVLATENVDATRAWAADDGGKILELGAGADLTGLSTLPDGKSAFVVNASDAARAIGQTGAGAAIEVQPGEIALVVRTGASSARVAFLPAVLFSL